MFWVFIIIQILICHGLTKELYLLKESMDLTWAFDEETVNWPNTRRFQFTKKLAHFQDDGRWYAMNEFCTAEHSGTHFDAPYHFNKDGWKVGDVPIGKLVGAGVLIDLSDEVSLHGPNATLQPEHIVSYEKIFGRILKESIVLISFDWGKYYTDKKHYLGLQENTMSFPGVTREAAEMLAQRDIAGVGLDTPSIDPGSSTSYEAHRLLAAQNIYVLENVNIPDKLPAKGFTLFVMPMKIRDGTGAPCRIVAIPDVTLTHTYRKPLKTSALYASAASLPWYAHSSVILCALLLLGMYTINCYTL